MDSITIHVEGTERATSGVARCWCLRRPRPQPQAGAEGLSPTLLALRLQESDLLKGLWYGWTSGAQVACRPGQLPL